jgi:acetyl esterase/lipase
MPTESLTLRVVSLLSSTILVVLAAGCADRTTSDRGTSTAATTIGASLSERPSEPAQNPGRFAVETDLVFMTVDGADLVVDVYVPNGQGPWPVAVVFHGRSSDGKDTASTTSIAEAAATAGMVVFAPTWYTGDPFPLGIDDIDHLGVVGNCAVAFARAHASEHGGDPTRIVVYGFSAGTGPALVSVLDPGEGQIPGCRSPLTATSAAGAVLGDGETFWHSAAFDGAFDEDLDAMQDSVASLTDPTRWPPDLDTEFFIWAAADGTAPRDVHDSGNPTWITERDPAGSIRSDLERLDQLADDVVSYVDAAHLLELRLREAGVDVTLEIMPGGHTVAEKLPLLVDWLLDASG